MHINTRKKFSEVGFISLMFIACLSFWITKNAFIIFYSVIFQNCINSFIALIIRYTILYLIILCYHLLYIILRGIATERGGGGVGGRGTIAPHFNFRTKQGPTVSASYIRDISFYGCSEIKRTRNFTIFTVNAKIFGQFTAAFHNYIGEINHFTLDLLKRSDTRPWTFWKVSYCGLFEGRL